MSEGGALSEVFEADGKIQSMCDTVRNEVEARLRKKYEMFKSETYKTQDVDGTKYFIKVHVGGDDHLHLAVSHKLHCDGGDCLLTNIREGKSHHDPIEPF